MNECEEIRSRLTSYLDKELEGGERTSLEAHVRDCSNCRAMLEMERQFLETIRASAPLECAPPELNQRVHDITQKYSETASLAAIAPFAARNSWLKPWRVVALASLIIATVIVIIFIAGRSHKAPSGPSQFALLAADTHLRHTRGQLPLELNSNDAEKISSWFVNKVGFQVQLPNYQEVSGQEKLYRLIGARLVTFNGDYAAYVAYEMNQRPISLVITSANLAAATGGEEIKAKGLTFHYDAINGLKVITWSDRGLTYALISNLEERGQQSCVVCHQGTKDRDFIEPLRPRQ